MSSPASPATGSRYAAALTHANVLAIAVPIIIANVTTPLIGIVDTAVLGQLGDAHYIGAVAIGAMIFNMVYWAFGFLRMGTTGLTAQAEGRGDRDEVAATLARALIIAGVCGLALVVLQWPLSEIAFALIGGSEPVEKGAAEYFTIRIWSAPAALANYALLGWFIGRGRAGTAMVLQILLNGTNAALDALFVLVFAWGVTGVAIGTLLSEIFAVVCGLWFARRMLRHAGAHVSRERALNAAALKKVVAVNADIMVRTLALLFAFAFFTAQSAEAGDITLAANTILMHLVMFAAYFLDGFAFSAESLVGNAIGAGRRQRFREAVRMTTLWAAVISIGLAAIFWVFGGLIVHGLSVNPEIRAEAMVYLFWAAIVTVISFPCFQLDGIFIGATRSADMRNMALLCTAIYLAAWAVLTPLWGNHGLWCALAVLNVARGLTLASRYPALERASFHAA